jgi:mannose-1-phosphate guanylyltransferase
MTKDALERFDEEFMVNVAGHLIWNGSNRFPHNSKIKAFLTTELERKEVEVAAVCALELASKDQQITVLKADHKLELERAKREAIEEAIKEIYMIHNGKNQKLCMCAVAQMLKKKFLTQSNE